MAIFEFVPRLEDLRQSFGVRICQSCFTHLCPLPVGQREREDFVTEIVTCLVLCPSLRAFCYIEPLIIMQVHCRSISLDVLTVCDDAKIRSCEGGGGERAGWNISFLWLCVTLIVFRYCQITVISIRTLLIMVSNNNGHLALLTREGPKRLHILLHIHIYFDKDSVFTRLCCRCFVGWFLLLLMSNC